MAKTVTLSSLRTQIRQRCEMENSTFVSDSELNAYINASYGELYDLLVATYGSEYYLSSTTFSTASGTESYSLPATFYKLVGVDALRSGTEYVTLQPFMFAERNQDTTFTRHLPSGIPAYRYRIQGANILLHPIPTEIRTIRVWFVPAFTSLSGDSDTLDGVNGWEEYIVVDGCIKALAKEESDASVFMMQKEALKKRIEAMAPDRDSGMPLRMIDVRGWSAHNEEDFI